MSNTFCAFSCPREEVIRISTYHLCSYSASHKYFETLRCKKSSPPYYGRCSMAGETGRDFISLIQRAPRWHAPYGCRNMISSVARLMKNHSHGAVWAPCSRVTVNGGVDLVCTCFSSPQSRLSSRLQDDRLAQVESAQTPTPTTGRLSAYQL